MRSKVYKIGNMRVQAINKKSAMGNRRVLAGPPPLWTVTQLPVLMVGDILAFKAEPGFEQWVVSRQGAVTWHWALVGEWFPPDVNSGVQGFAAFEDRQIIGSINKGIATELLSAYNYRQMRIYRPKLNHQVSLRNDILRRCAYYGSYEYNWLGVAESAVEYLLKEIGIRVRLPVSHRFYCIQFVARIMQDFGLHLVDDWQGVTPYDIENSSKLEKIWGTF